MPFNQRELAVCVTTQSVAVWFTLAGQSPLAVDKLRDSKPVGVVYLQVLDES
jgi:hypothetical protein